MKDENSAHSYSEGSEVPPDNETVEDGGGCYVAGSREETIQEMDDKFADAAKKSIANAKEYKMKEQDAAHSFGDQEDMIKRQEKFKHAYADELLKDELTRLRSELQQAKQEIERLKDFRSL